MKKSILFTITLAVFVHFANAQWQQTSLDSTTTWSFAINNNDIFAGTQYGGLYISSDNGDNWIAANNGFTDSFISAIAISGSNIFAGTWTSGMFISTDNGSNWTSLISMFSSSIANSPTVTSLAISGSNIFAGTGAGVFLSFDNGVTWTEANTGMPYSVEDLEISGSNIFAGTWGHGVYLSSDNGNNWTAVNTGLTYPYINTLAISGDTIFAGTHNGGVFISTNNGSAWNEANSGLPLSSWIKSLAISGNNIFAGTDDGVFLSSNNGDSWIAANTGLTNTNVYSLAINGDALFAGCYNGGVWKRSITDILNTNCSAQFTIIPDTLIQHHYFIVNYATGEAPLSYIWNWGDGTYDTTAFPSHTYSTEGFYNVCLTISNSYGCSSTFCDTSYVQKSENTIIYVDVIPSGATAINENEFSDQKKIYPNPANEEINIYSSQTSGSIEQIRIIDILGRERYYSDKAVTSVNTAFLEQGVYFLEIKEKDRLQVVMKFIISR